MALEPTPHCRDSAARPSRRGVQVSRRGRARAPAPRCEEKHVIPVQPKLNGPKPASGIEHRPAALPEFVTPGAAFKPLAAIVNSVEPDRAPFLKSFKLLVRDARNDVEDRRRPGGEFLDEARTTIEPILVNRGLIWKMGRTTSKSSSPIRSGRNSRRFPPSMPISRRDRVYSGGSTSSLEKPETQAPALTDTTRPIALLSIALLIAVCVDSVDSHVRRLWSEYVLVDRYKLPCNN